MRTPTLRTVLRRDLVSLDDDDDAAGASLLDPESCLMQTPTCAQGEAKESPIIKSIDGFRIRAASECHPFCSLLLALLTFADSTTG